LFRLHRFVVASLLLLLLRLIELRLPCMIAALLLLLIRLHLLL
jgi:hypothetical protein